MLNQTTVLRSLVLAWIRERLGDESGASLVEYALLLALIVAVAIGAIALLGGSTANLLNDPSNVLNKP